MQQENGHAILILCRRVLAKELPVAKFLNVTIAVSVNSKEDVDDISS